MKRNELVIVAVAVTALIAVTSWATYANGLVQYWSPRYPQQNQGYGLGGGMMGGGMMGGYFNQGYQQATPNQPQQYYGQGMMGGYFNPSGPRQTSNQSLAHCSLGATGSGAGMMGGGGMIGGGMMGYYQNVSTALTQDEAAQIAENYLASLNNPDLMIGEFEEYSHNFYVSIVENSTGKGAVEILIDRFTGFVHPEPQSMMWNNEYGGMGSMMGGGWFGSQGSGALTVTPEEAKQIAQRFLNITYPGTEVDDIVTFDGYYTIMTTLGGNHYGMLSINGYTGAVWYHTWHGLFISEVDVQ